MRLALAAVLALAATPAAADGSLTWGRPLDSAAGPNVLDLVRCEGGACAARVTFHNSHLKGFAFTRRFTLDMGGLPVAVTITEGEAMAPDEIAVTPPPGFAADPPRLVVEEDGTGIVTIRPLPMS
jgi:hypothetical protein